MAKHTKPEAAFQKTVIDMAHLFGWKVAHFRASRTAKGWTTAVSADGKGWPDLFLCHEKRRLAIARELKIPPNKLTTEQKDWLDTLNAAGIDAKLWTPDDWDEIEAILSGATTINPAQSHSPTAADCAAAAHTPAPPHAPTPPTLETINHAPTPTSDEPQNNPPRRHD